VTPAGARLDAFLNKTITELKGKSASMALADLKHLAAKNRDRIDRITARAAALDQRGDAMEQTSNTVLDQHEAVIAGLEGEMKQIDQFNSEMAAQLGNLLPTEQK